MVRIRFLYLRPTANAIPLVVSQVDVEDCPLRVNGDWVDDCYSPREAIDEFGERVAILSASISGLFLSAL